MTGLADMVLRPWWLAAIPLCIALGFFLKRRGTALGSWTGAIDPALMTAMDRLGRVAKGSQNRAWLAPLIAGLIGLALVGPFAERKSGTAFRNLDGIVIALDLSRSMAEGGRLPDVLTATRLLAKRAGSRQLSLIVFAGDAYVASALTSDISAVDQTIADLGIETVPDDGSRPERALALALRIIEDAEIAFGDVVLVTDGGGIGPEAQSEAVKLARAGVPLSTLYIPSSKAGDPLKLASLAETGGGASAQLRDPFPVAEALDQGFNRRLAATDYAALMRVDYGRYLLVLALLPALALFRRQA